MAKLLYIVVIALMVNIASCYKSVYKGEDCNTCLANTATWSAVCRSKYSTRISFCCDSEDMEK